MSPILVAGSCALCFYLNGGGKLLNFFTGVWERDDGGERVILRFCLFRLEGVGWGCGYTCGEGKHIAYLYKSSSNSE